VRTETFKPVFVEFMPKEIDEGVLYVSMEYSVAIHKCACGCGNKVPTPLSPTDWQLFFDGRTVSLEPSVGNWNFPCQSHYFIYRNDVDWAKPMSRQAIEGGRQRNRGAKTRYYASESTVDVSAPVKAPEAVSPIEQSTPKAGALARAWHWLMGRR